MNTLKKRTWGKSKLKYCPKLKLVWQLDNNDNVKIYIDMPSYGLERQECPV